MKLSHLWLKRYLPDLPDPDRVKAGLEQLGFEVASGESFGGEYATVELVAVLDRNPHPNADRLSVLTVRRGSGETVAVVTGARNGTPGQHLWYGPPGTRLPDGRTLATKTLRGVPSPGMLLSGDELGFHTGDEDLWVWEGADPVGTRLMEVLGGEDFVYELELTPNLQVYAQSVIAIARELGAVLGLGPVKAPDPFDYGQSDDVVRVQVPDDCPLYGLVSLDLVPGATAPIWMQALLRAAGQRLIHPAVDITNFVLWDLGQPLHAFDADRVTLPIEVRRARPGEVLELLDGQTVTLTPHDLVIADGQGPLALAGVMGGTRAAVTEKTRRVWLECAQFDASLIFSTVRKRGLFTDAGLHFGKGTDPQAVMQAPTRVLEVLTESGALSAVGKSVLQGRFPPPRRVGYDPERIRGLLGGPWSDAQITQALEAMGHRVEGSWVTLPSWRHDVEGTADLAEDVARFIGIDHIPERLPVMATTLGHVPFAVRFFERLRDLWAEAGYWEVVTRRFSSEAREGILERRAAEKALTLTNPLRDEENRMRTDLLTSLLEVMMANRGRRDWPLSLFEVAPVFTVHGDRVQETMELAVVQILEPAERYPRGPDPSILDLKGALAWVARRLNWPLRMEPDRDPPGYLHPGRTVAIYDGKGAPRGHLGELRPRVAEYFRARRVGVLVMTADAAKPPKTDGVRPHPSKYPEVVRDLSLVVSEAISYRQLTEWIAQVAVRDLKRVVLVDRFLGNFGLSLTLRLTFQSERKTLTDAEVDEAIAKILSKLGEAGVTIRQ